MIFSMCLRRSGNTGMFLHQHNILRLVTVPTIKPILYSTISKSTSLQNILSKNSIQPSNFVERFSTSMVRQEYEKPHDHAKLWIIEKGTTVCLLFLIPIGLLIPNKYIDTLLAILITAHAYWGMEALVVEYLRVLLFGPMIPKIAMGVVYGLTVIMLGGLFYLNLNDIGMSRAFWRIWRNMRKPYDTTPGGSSKCS